MDFLDEFWTKLKFSIGLKDGKDVQLLVPWRAISFFDVRAAVYGTLNAERERSMDVIKVKNALPDVDSVPVAPAPQVPSCTLVHKTELSAS